MGNKSDLRDPCCSDSQVRQKLAMGFCKAHSMMFFETSAKNPPKACWSNGPGTREGPYQQDQLEDIVAAVGATLKSQRKASIENPPAYSGSFKVLTKKKPEKEVWTCC